MAAQNMQSPVQSGPIGPPTAPGAKTAFDPSALSMPDAARLLGISEAVLRQHVEQGAPVSPNGTINLVHYAAWLNLPPSARRPPAAPVGADSTDDTDGH